MPYFIFSILLFPTLLWSQYYPVGSPLISHFEKSDYHAGTQNWSVVQDGRGIMYFGNNKGLLEFDGTAWRIFRLPNQTIVRSTALGKQGRLYVGGQDEFGYLASDDLGNVSYISLIQLIPDEYKSFEDIWKIFVFDQQIFFCSQRAIFQLKGKKIEVISPSRKFENFFECEGKFYAQDTQEGLLVWQNNQFIPLPNGLEFTSSRIAAILPFQPGQTLIVTASNGLFLMDQNGIKPWQVEVSNFLTTYQAYCAIQLSDGQFAIGTAHNGLLITSSSGDPVMHLNQANGLQNNTVLSIYQDKHQNLWLGLDNGIDYVESSAPFSIISKEVGVEGTGYVSIIHNNKLYLGTNQGLYYIDWPKNENPFIPGKFQRVQQIKGQVWSLNKLGDDLIVGLHEGAFQVINDRIIPISDIEGAWKFLQLKQNPDFAIEGTYSGLYLYKRQVNASADNSANWEVVGKLRGFDESARVLEQDNAGHIWVSHAYKGLYRMRLDLQDQIIKDLTFYNADNGLPSDINVNVARIRNELVFTTPEGIYYYEEASNQFLKHEELNQVFGADENILRLLEDQTGNIWFSVEDNFGLLKVREQGLFNQIDKIFFNQLQEKIMTGFEHVYAYDKHNVFVATEKGFIHYNPTSNKDFQLPFQTLIRSVTYIEKGNTIIFGGSAPSESIITNESSNFQFPHKTNDFKFTYSTSFFEQINHIEYRYRLEGFQENWSEWTIQTEKEYTNLPPGNYAFIVEARNAYAQTSAAARFPFVINPPWTATIWAKIVYALILLIILSTVYWYLNRQAQKEQEKLKEKQAKELQQQEAEFKKEVEKSEAEIIKLRNENLLGEINHKNSQLAAATMHLVQKGEMLNRIKQDLNKLLPNIDSENKKQIKRLIRSIVEDARLDDNWEQFEFHFDQVHENFLKRLREKHPALTPKDQKLCAYLRMNLSTKEIAPLMNISVRGVEISRYRIRKKLEVDSNTNLIDFMMNV